MPLQGFPAIMTGGRLTAVANPCSGGLCTNLNASWKLSDLVDATGNGNTLTNNNTVTFSTGKIGNAAYFVAASNQSLSIANNAYVGVGDSDFSLGCWFWLDTVGVNQSLMAKDDEDNSRRDYRLVVNGDNTLSWIVFHAGGSANIVTTAGTVTTGTWYNVVAWHDAAGDQIGIVINDGTPATDVSGGALSAASAAKFTLGARDTAGGPQYLNGRIDDANIWQKKLSAADITAFYNSGNGVEYPYTTP